MNRIKSIVIVGLLLLATISVAISIKGNAEIGPTVVDPTNSPVNPNATTPTAVASNPPLLPGATISPTVVNASNSHMLVWKSGQPYPVFNGRPVPPPVAQLANPNATSPPTAGGHWYAGSVFNGTSTLGSWIISRISTPSATPDSSEFYYVLTSAFDNAGSYDQIGFADNFGVWGLAESYTTGSCSSPTYVYSADAMNLVPGQQYELAMGTVSGPGTWLEVYTVSASGSITLVWFLHAPTTATDPGLEVQNFYCGYYDYTDYEEVYGTMANTQPDPYGAPGGLQFYFHYNEYYTTFWTTTPWIAWKTSNAPPGTYAWIGKYSTVPELVTINNYKPPGY